MIDRKLGRPPSAFARIARLRLKRRTPRALAAFGQASSPKIQTQILENIVKFQLLFPLGRGKWTIRVERDECLEVHKLLILMALPTGVEPVISD